MQWITRLDVLLGLEVKPTLPPFGCRARIPGERKRLQASRLDLDQILLEGLDPERVKHGEPGQFPVGAERFHHESGSVPQEPRRLRIVARLDVAEIAEHRLFGCTLHR